MLLEAISVPSLTCSANLLINPTDVFVKQDINPKLTILFQSASVVSYLLHNPVPTFVQLLNNLSDLDSAPRTENVTSGENVSSEKTAKEDANAVDGTSETESVTVDLQNNLSSLNNPNSPKDLLCTSTPHCRPSAESVEVIPNAVNTVTVCTVRPWDTTSANASPHTKEMEYLVLKKSEVSYTSIYYNNPPSALLSFKADSVRPVVVSSVLGKTMVAEDKKLTGCDKVDFCHENAECVFQYSSAGPSYICHCLEGYSGNGIICKKLKYEELEALPSGWSVDRPSGSECSITNLILVSP